MKNNVNKFAAILFASAITEGGAQTYTNFVRQVQVNSNAEMEVSVGQTGERLSPLEINPGGARFELWAVDGTTLTPHLLDQRYVGAYVPRATLEVRSEDPYQTRPRTRADRPFDIVVNLDGLLADPSAPEASRMVNLQHFAQSYGASGTGVGVDPNSGELQSSGTMVSNGTETLLFESHSIPGTGGNRAKARGFERFVVESLPDYQAPPAQVAAGSIQIWPVADGTITGVEHGDKLRFKTPDLTVTLNDLYPDSLTYAQVYKGSPALGTIGTVVPGSAIVVNGAVPESRVLVLDDWDSVIEESGDWTIELLTETPFGTDRLFNMSFNINRDIKINGSVTTVE